MWIDQDLCTGDGLCTDHCPEIFVILEDGIAYVRDGMDIGNDPGGAGSMVPVAPDFQQRHTIYEGKEFDGSKGYSNNFLNFPYDFNADGYGDVLTAGFPGTRALRNHPATYTVAASDETVYSIACLFGDVDPSAIAQANNISPGAALSAGQQLSIP